MKKYFALIILIFFPYVADAAAQKAQKDSLASINGKIYDGSAEDLGSATFHPNIQLVTFDGEKADTSYTAADRDGVFSFRNIRPQKVYLKVFCVGRKTIEGYYELAAGRNAFFFTMEDAPQQIDESKVTAEVPLMKQIADTTIYNAAAVRTMDGESLRAILEQLPGFKVSRNRITVDGEEIKRTYINGVLVFGDNPLTAVGALKADEVTQVRVYDEQNAVDKRRGLKHSKKDRVLDVVTKEPLLRLAEAGVLGEGGADETGQLRYSGAAALAYYSEMLQIVALGGLDNVGNSLSNNNYNYFGDVGSNLKGAMKSSDTYTESEGGNIDIEKYWKDRNYGNKASVNYRYARKYQKSASQVLTDYFAVGDNPAMSSADTSSSRAVSGTHFIQLFMDLKDTPLKSVYFISEAEISENTGSSLTAAKTITEGSPDILARHETIRSESRNYKVDNGFIWTNNDAAKIRPTLKLDFNIAGNNTLSWTVDTLATSFDRRQMTSDGFGNSLYGFASFNLATALINNEKRSLSLNAGVSSGYNRSKTKTLTVDEIDGYEIDFANTYDNTWNNLTNSIDVGVDYNARSLNVTGGISMQYIIQKDDERFPVQPYSADEGTWDRYSNDRNYFAVAPTMDFTYKSFLLSVGMTPSIPSIEQTRKRISDANPLVLTGGNPELSPSYNSSLDMSWFKPVAKGLGRISLHLNATCNFSPIVTKTQYFSENTVLTEWDGYQALAGSMLHTFENASRPAWSANLQLSAFGLMFKRKLTVSLMPGFSYSSFPQYYGQDLIGVNEMKATGVIDLKYRPKRFLNFTAKATCSYVNSLNDGYSSLSERFVSTAIAGATIAFAKYGNFRVSYNFADFHYLGGIGTDFFTHSLDSEISWDFLKRSLTVALKGIDLLNQGRSYTNNVTADASTQTWKPVYGRYFMLSIKYLFRKK